MESSKLANKITEALWTEAEKDYPIIAKIVPETKKQEVRKKIFETVLKEIIIDEVKR